MRLAHLDAETLARRIAEERELSKHCPTIYNPRLNALLLERNRRAELAVSLGRP